MNRVGAKDKVRFEQANQTLSFEAPQGRPSADGTVTLYDPRAARTDTTRNPIVTGTATRLAVDTTTSAAAGPSQADPRRVPCTPPAACKVGSFVFLTNEFGQVERIEVAGKDADEIRSAYPLSLDFATGSTVQSAEMTSPAIPTAWVSDLDNLVEDLEAVWSYTVGGVAYVATTRWDLTREVPALEVLDSVLLERWPDLKQFKFQAHPQTFAPLGRAAARDVDNIFRMRGYDPDRMRGNEVMSYLTELRQVVLIARNGLIPSRRDVQAFVDEVSDEWKDARLAFLEGRLKVAYYDENQDAVVQDAEKRVNKKRIIR